MPTSRGRALVSAVGELVGELCGASPEFDALWRDNEVHTHAEGESVKRLHHPTLGLIALEQSAFSVDGRPDLHMINPIDAGQAGRIRWLIEQS